MSLVNPSTSTAQTAWDMGFKAGTAVKRHDVALKNFTRDFFRRWIVLQPADDRRALDESYNAGYTDGASGGFR